MSELRGSVVTALRLSNHMNMCIGEIALLMDEIIYMICNDICRSDQWLGIGITEKKFYGFETR